MMQTIAEINRRYAEVFAGQYTLVPGEGNVRARLMLVGEAPGSQEEAQRRPFVGTAGKHLDAFLEGIGLAREALYITNTVKFRPTRQGANGRLSNRTPTPAEVALFRPWLLEEIDAIRPEVVATLGNTALRAVSGKALVIGDVHGRPLPTEAGYVLFPLYHPASILYRRALKVLYEADIRRLADFLR